jgi:hypothetical protein
VKKAKKTFSGCRSFGRSSPAPPPLTEQASETITNKYHFNTFPNSSSLSLPNANSFDNWIPLDPSLDPHLDRFPNENYPLPSTLALDTFNFSNFGASSSTPAQPNSFFFSNQEPIRIPASYSTQSNPAFTTNEPHFPAVSPAVTHQAVNQTLFMNESHIPVTPPVTPQAVNQTFMTNEPHIPAVTYQKYTVTTNTVQRPTTVYRLVRCARTTLGLWPCSGHKRHIAVPFLFAVRIVLRRSLILSPFPYQFAVTLLIRRCIINSPLHY